MIEVWHNRRGEAMLEGIFFCLNMSGMDKLESLRQTGMPNVMAIALVNTTKKQCFYSELPSHLVQAKTEIKSTPFGTWLHVDYLKITLKNKSGKSFTVYSTRFSRKV